MPSSCRREASGFTREPAQSCEARGRGVSFCRFIARDRFIFHSTSLGKGKQCHLPAFLAAWRNLRKGSSFCQTCVLHLACLEGPWKLPRALLFLKRPLGFECLSWGYFCVGFAISGLKVLPIKRAILWFGSASRASVGCKLWHISSDVPSAWGQNKERKQLAGTARKGAFRSGTEMLSLGCVLSWSKVLQGMWQGAHMPQPLIP